MSVANAPRVGRTLRNASRAARRTPDRCRPSRACSARRPNARRPRRTAGTPLRRRHHPDRRPSPEARQVAPATADEGMIAKSASAPSDRRRKPTDADDASSRARTGRGAGRAEERSRGQHEGHVARARRGALGHERGSCRIPTRSTEGSLRPAPAGPARRPVPHRTGCHRAGHGDHLVSARHAPSGPTGGERAASRRFDARRTLRGDVARSRPLVRDGTSWSSGSRGASA